MVCDGPRLGDNEVAERPQKARAKENESFSIEDRHFVRVSSLLANEPEKVGISVIPLPFWLSLGVYLK